MRFEVILPVFNQPGYTEKCIRDLYATGNSFVLTVLDNGSLFKTKVVLDRLQKAYAFEIVRSEINKPWPSIINEFLKNKKTDSDYCVLLQNDCFVFEDFFKNFLDTIPLADPQAKIFLPKTCYSRMPFLIYSPEIGSKFSKYKHPNKGMPKTFEMVHSYIKEFYDSIKVENSEPHKRLTYCNNIDSYCMIVKTEIFKEGLLFNEQFKTLGWVEKEWYNRVLQKGYEAWVLNDIYVHHHGNLTTDGNGWNYGKLLAEDEKLYKELAKELTNGG
jgi:GT2 family glycosyltransferase